MPQKTGPSILLPFKQTKGHLCAPRASDILPNPPHPLLAPRRASTQQLNRSPFPYLSLFLHRHLESNSALLCFSRGGGNRSSIFGINTSPLSPFASCLFPNRAPLRAAGALLNSIPLLLSSQALINNRRLEGPRWHPPANPSWKNQQ